MSVASARGRAPARSWSFTRSERLLAAVPLLTVFFWLALIYSWESWGHVTPWLFTDELESAQLSRAIAETGHAARRGVPHGFQSLFNYLIAPAWWFSNAHQAYAAIKYISAFTMSAVVFPTYWLGRMIMSKRWALFAAATAAAIPAMVYSSFLVEEPLAYPFAALCFFLIAKALTRRTRWWIGAAIFTALLAPAVRGQLAVIPGVLFLAALFRFWGSERMRAWRTGWSRGDWIGAFVLIAGGATILNAYISHHSYAWFVATLLYKGRMIDYGLWAAGALTIGLGVFPVIAGLTALFPPRGLGTSDEERAFRCVAFAGIGLVGFYTAVKAAYISTVFSTLVEERNLIYVTPRADDRDGTRPAARPCPSSADRGRRRAGAVRDPDDAVPDGLPLLLRRAGARDPPGSEPEVPLDAGLRPERAGRDGDRLAPAPRAPACDALARAEAARDRGRNDRTGGLHLEHHGADHGEHFVQVLLRAVQLEHREAARLARPVERRQAHDLPRAEHHRPERHLGARVLEPVDPLHVEPRRERDQSRLADPHARRRRADRHAAPVRGPARAGRREVRRRRRGDQHRRFDRREAQASRRRRPGATGCSGRSPRPCGWSTRPRSCTTTAG